MTAVLKGLVLAGGQSRRFVSDKAAVVVLRKQSQLSYLFALLAEILPEVFVSVRPEQGIDGLRAQYPQVVDMAVGLGPTGGLLAAHTFDPEAAWLVVACDMPLLSRAVLQALLDGRNPQRGATAFVGSDGLPEPLCAIYEPATLAALQAGIAAGRDVAVPRSLLINTDTTLLKNPAGSIYSFNTPDELARLRTSSGAVRSNN